MQAVLPFFDTHRFIKEVYREDFDQLEFKQRMRRTSEVMHLYMPSNFAEAAPVIKTLALRLQNRNFANGIEFLFLPDYIEIYGIDEFELATEIFETMTQVVTCEFAVRPFILRDPDRMLEVMKKWSRHADARVRRLASEGSRPRLPWAMAIPFLKANPEPILPILTNLLEDPNEMVRRSVANSLNDISRDNPALVVSLTAKWGGRSEWTDAILRHGCRTLLRQGHPDILRHYELDAEGMRIDNFRINTPTVEMGDKLQFSFTVRNLTSKPRMVRLAYGLYYLRKNGSLSRKVFLISETLYQAGAVRDVERSQSFRLITTRQFYPGVHRISVIINGEEKAQGSILLMEISNS